MRPLGPGNEHVATARAQRGVVSLERRPPVGATGGAPVFMPGPVLYNGPAIFNAHVSNANMPTFIDSAVPGNCYARFTGSGGSPNYTFMFMAMNIGKFDGVNGPAGASGIDAFYYFHQIVRQGPDCGEYTLEIASAEVGGEILGVTDGGLTWVEILNDDLYAASTDWGDPWDSDSKSWRTWYVKLTGAAGDVATSYLGRFNGGLDGGPGLYYFRWILNGKNASSSNYRFDIAQFGASLSPV